MKKDLPWFHHYNSTHNEPRMQALLAQYGFEGYGRYWILCEKIAASPYAVIDISSRIIKLTITRVLGLNAEDFDSFIEFLNAPDINLIKFENDKITTNHLQEDYSKVANKRERDRVYYNTDCIPKAENEIPSSEMSFSTSENIQNRSDNNRRT